MESKIDGREVVEEFLGTLLEKRKQRAQQKIVIALVALVLMVIAWYLFFTTDHKLGIAVGLLLLSSVLSGIAK